MLRRDFPCFAGAAMPVCLRRGLGNWFGLRGGGHATLSDVVPLLSEMGEVNISDLEKKQLLAFKPPVPSNPGEINTGKLCVSHPTATVPGKDGGRWDPQSSAFALG